MPDLKAIQHYCAYQERCHSEVRTKLLQLGFRGADLENAIVALIEDNFLNEERYAQQFVSGKYRIKQWGINKIKVELKRKGVSDYCINKAMQTIDQRLYFQNLSSLAQKKIVELTKEKNIWIRKQKLQRYLMQKGYEIDLISEVSDLLIEKK